MKKIKFFLMVLCILLLGSCTQKEDSPLNLPQTRSVNIDLKKVGSIHNLMLDFVDSISYLNPSLRSGDFKKNPQLQSMHEELSEYIINEAGSDLQCSSEELAEVFAAYEFIYDGTPYNPVIFMDQSNTSININTYSWIDPFLYNIEISTQEEYFLRTIATIWMNKDGSPKSNTQIKEELNLLLKEWVRWYGEDALKNPTIDNVMSGTCLTIALSSFDWWHTYLNPSRSEKGRIAPYIAFLLGKDAKGALLGCLSSYICGEREPKTILINGLVSGGLSSICARL